MGVHLSQEYRGLYVDPRAHAVVFVLRWILLPRPPFPNLYTAIKRHLSGTESRDLDGDPGLSSSTRR